MSSRIEHWGEKFGHPVRSERVTGVILAGGQSRRYGRNKAFEEIQGLTLIERVARVMEGIFARVILITNSPGQFERMDLPMYEDLIKGLGPLGGIYTGLSVIPKGAGFFVACDMPCLNPGLIRYIVGIRGDYDAVVPRISGYMEALHALYGKTCLPAIEELIASGQYQTLKFFEKVRVRFVEDGEIRRYDPDFLSFLNINRPEDLRRLKESWRN